jgi:hypothetical protein
VWEKKKRDWESCPIPVLCLSLSARTGPDQLLGHQDDRLRIAGLAFAHDCVKRRRGERTEGKR